VKKEIPDPPDSQLLELVYRQGCATSKASFAAALAGFLVFGVHGINLPLLLWVGGVLLASGLRIYLLQRRLKQLAASPENKITRGRTHYWTGLISAASWGGLAFLPAEHLPVHAQSLAWAVPFLVATVAMSTYSTIISHFRDYLIVLTLCVLGGILLQHGVEALGAALTYLLFGPVIYAMGERFHGFMLQAKQSRDAAEQALVDLESANQHLQQQKALLNQEEDIARHVFAQLTLASEDNSGIRTWNQAMGNLSGDLIQVANGPLQQTYIFLGDFTGHGLPAALGAVPTSTIFQAMAKKGLPISVIATELNHKLHSLLPTGYFCCAAIIELSADRSRLRLWNGGLPPLIIRQGDSGRITQVAADNLPLGVVDHQDFNDNCTEWTLRAGDSVYIYSDGLTEAQNVDGEMWGRERLVQFLSRPDLNSPRLEPLKQQLMQFTEQAPASDDISIIEIQAAPRQSSRDVA